MPIGPDVVLGYRVRVFQPDLVNLYGCTIGDDTKIGAFVEIQKDAVIGACRKVSSHTFVCKGPLRTRSSEAVEHEERPRIPWP